MEENPISNTTVLGRHTHLTNLYYYFSSTAVDPITGKKKNTKINFLLEHSRILIVLLAIHAVCTILACVIFRFVDSIVIPAVVFAISLPASILSAVFVLLLLQIKKEFRIWREAQDNAETLKPQIFKKQKKFYIWSVGTALGFFATSVLMFVLNLTHILKHDNILNIILPIVLLITSFVVSSLVQNFGWFLDEVCEIEVKRQRESPNIYSYTSSIKNHEWPKLRNAGAIGDKLAKVCNSIARAFNYQKYEFADLCEQFSQSDYQPDLMSR